jgi:hypothetical protein
VHSDVFLVIDFVNLKIKSAQLCVRVFIWVGAHTCMSICVCIMFLKKEKIYRKRGDVRSMPQKGDQTW